MLVIYKILNLVNGKIYIGQTKKTVKQRVAKHKKENRYYIQRTLNKYGLDSFEVSVIDESEVQEELDDKERYWIKFYDCRAPKGYNCTDGGDGVRGYEYTDEARLKMSMANLGRHPSEETLRKRSIALKGKVRSAETRKKMSDAKKGKHLSLSPEQRMNRSLAKKGKKLGPLSEETKRKIGEANSKKHPSEETKMKLRLANLGKHMSEETKRKIGSKSKGRRPWNYGLTKGTDARVKMNYEKIKMAVAA